MKGLKVASFIMAFLFCAAIMSAGCDLIEQADKLKEAVEDMAEYELKRAIEEEVEKKVDEEVDKRRVDSKDILKKIKKGSAEDTPTAAGKLILRNGKKIEFKSILNLFEVKGLRKDKPMNILLQNLSELELLSSDSDCVCYELGREEHSDNCRIQVKTKGKGKVFKLTKASVRQGMADKKRGQCVYLDKKAGTEKSMGMRKIKKIVFYGD